MKYNVHKSTHIIHNTITISYTIPLTSCYFTIKYDTIQFQLSMPPKNFHFRTNRKHQPFHSFPLHRTYITKPPTVKNSYIVHIQPKNYDSTHKETIRYPHALTCSTLKTSVGMTGRTPSRSGKSVNRPRPLMSRFGGLLSPLPW